MQYRGSKLCKTIRHEFSFFQLYLNQISMLEKNTDIFSVLTS